MKEQESQATEQNEQSTTTQQATASKPRKNGVFMMRGKDQSWEEFVRICIQSLKDAGLIKEEPRPPKVNSDHALNEQNLPDKKDQ
ncbi:MAG: hypothetical protein BWX99_00989 [Deltaproteobacteria bacterium ADurb.Bin151]|jgi:hypothetical protein|nr:MAG: hypothetical protein BWX99_00989 [Deltaproteobacteria bacterium ADurb.Bin151]HPL66132.1 hypothetical protein [Smithellaceae bacterium]HQP25717.1 hypothetical protein [Smithellaceae bacterium]